MKRYWIIVILVLAAVLRLYGLERGDTMNDEVFYAFRAIGMLDFDKAPNQPTPLEWFDPDIPWWTKLSFHDHPPLVFWVQHFFMNIFGDSAWAFRLPSALLGIASVYLVYLIGVILFSETAGLTASAFFAVTLNNIYISRTGMQEPYAIFFILLASYFFLKAVGVTHPLTPSITLREGEKREKYSLSRGRDSYLIWTGLALGLGFLTKYNVFIMAPIFLAYLAIYKRDYFSRKKLWLGALLAVLLFSPVIVYNLKMYQAVGHFDFQLSYIFQQNPKEWPVAPGKEIGALTDRVKNFIPRLIATNSWLFLILFAVSLLFLRNAFLFLVFGFLFLLFLFIGPAYRFLTMLAPWMALAIGTVFPKQKLFYYLLMPILAFEIFYSYNNQIAYYPKGPAPWLSSKVRYENYNWGYNALENYLKEELSGKMPALTFLPRYQFLNKLQDEAIARSKAQNLEPYPALLVYYGNIDDGPRLWIFDRWRFYRAWPIIDFETYSRFLDENGPDYYKKSGFKNFYFIMQTNIVPESEAAALIKESEPLSIFNPRGDEVFKVYKFSL